MFNDARNLPDGHEIETGVCIVGAGAAGIAIALELAGTGLDITLLESGGLELDAESQSLSQGEISSNLIRYSLEHSRLRVFGGTTGHWAGNCRPLDKIDFEKRPWVPHSGWPITLADLEPYYPRAHELCELGPYDYDPDSWATDTAPEVVLGGERIRTNMYPRSLPTRFGTRYRDDIRNATGIETYLYANVVGLSGNSNGREIRGVKVATLAGTTFHVRARLFILACGAVQNARLLLVSNEVGGGVAVDGRATVGRYFMEHIRAPAAILVTANPNLSFDLYLETHRRREAAEGAIGFAKAHFYLTEETQREEQLLNTTIRMDYPFWRSMSFYYARYLKYLMKAGEYGAEFWEQADAIISNLDNLSIRTYGRLWRRVSSYRVLTIHYQLEQVPDPENRVQLTEEKDRFGVPKLSVICRVGQTERQSARRTTEILAEEFGSAGIGRIRLLQDDPETGWPGGDRGLIGSWHHMGTTRMSRDPAQGVVDKNCKVHGVANLYVAGSAVFPTGGYATPTLTIVALATRLAKYVKGLPI